MKIKKQKTKQKKEQSKIKPSKNNQFKQKYFEFYDDIKHYTNGKEDW